MAIGATGNLRCAAAFAPSTAYMEWPMMPLIAVRSGQQCLYHLPLICRADEAVVEALRAEAEVIRVEAEEMEDRRLKVAPTHGWPSRPSRMPCTDKSSSKSGQWISV